MQFSVIIPVYNVSQYLDKCVRSVLSQTFTDFEVILVDDGSTDDSPAMCDAFAQQDDRVRVIHKPNGGLVSARNSGIMSAKGDYICYVDGDDWAKDNMLQFIHERLENSPVPLDMVLFAAHNVFEDHLEETINKVPEGYYDRARLEKEIFPYLLSDRRNGFRAGDRIQAHTWNKACKRELQVEHYMRDERIRIFTDVPLMFECLLNCQNVYICNEHLYMYNKTNEQSIRAKGRQNYLTKSFYYLTKYMQDRLRGFSPVIDQGLNDMPVTLIIRTAMWRVETDGSFKEAVQHVKEGLRESELLDLITLKGLPPKPWLLVLLLKMHLYTPAMWLCAAKVKK